MYNQNNVLVMNYPIKDEVLKGQAVYLTDDGKLTKTAGSDTLIGIALEDSVKLDDSVQGEKISKVSVVYHGQVTAKAKVALTPGDYVKIDSATGLVDEDTTLSKATIGVALENIKANEFGAILILNLINNQGE